MHALLSSWQTAAPQGDLERLQEQSESSLGLVAGSTALTRPERRQPFAWPAREFLRSKVVGKPCTFELEETVASIGKSFGNVFINGENLAASIVAAGWAKVRRAPRPLLCRIGIRTSDASAGEGRGALGIDGFGVEGL